MKVEELINRYFDDGLDPCQVSELDKLLGASSEARAIYWQIAQTHALLDSALEEQSGAEWAVPLEPRKMKLVWLPAAAAAAVAIAVCWWIVTMPQEPIVKVVATANEGAELLQNGSLIMAAGEMREIVFLKGARVALEGPLEVELISDERMRLLRGKIGVEVPKGAEGFTVDTPEGEVIDHGTRFGLEIGPKGEIRAEVFEGRIDVVIGEETHRMEGRASLNFVDGIHGVVQGADLSSFPMPALKQVWQIEGGFNRKKSYQTGRPEVANQWVGDPVKIVGSIEGIKPRGHDGMLRFIETSSIDEELKTTASELWRIVDLAEVEEKMGCRPERVNLSGWVNRVAGDEQTDEAFLFALSCHHEIAEAFEATFRSRAKVENVMPSDSDPKTWERADLQLRLPLGLRYLVVMVGAIEDVYNDFNGPEFDGHFLDDVSLVFEAGMRSSVLHQYWRGSEGDWKNPAKWSNGHPPSPNSFTVVQGPGSAIISGEVSQDSGSLIVALDNDSEGSIYLPPGSTLDLRGSEMILGFNQGAYADAQISGTLVTGNRLFIGRNNERSTMTLSGSLVSSSLVQLSQYDTSEDTTAQLLIPGGSLEARVLKMIHDEASVTLSSGSIKAEELHLGGTNGRATMTINEGNVSIKRLYLGGGGGKATLIQNGGVVRIETLQRRGGEMQMNGEEGELWIKMPVTELMDILPKIPRETRGEWTIFSSAL